jgi:hypothetical protein
VEEKAGEIEKLERQSTQKVELGRLKELVMLNESLRGQEASFKASCKAHRQSLQDQIEVYGQGDDPEGAEVKKMASIEDMHKKVMNKYNNLRSFLAETNLEVSNSARIIDDIPTRSELIQYERRFVELYQQVAWKLEETRKYYAMYNTLDTSLSFLQKNVKILDSITATFDDGQYTRQGGVHDQHEQHHARLGHIPAGAGGDTSSQGEPAGPNEEHSSETDRRTACVLQRHKGVSERMRQERVGHRGHREQENG